MIGIVDYGMGNLTSVRNALAFIGAEARIIHDVAEIDECTKLVLPGVGAFGRAMEALTDRGYVPALRQHALVRRRPLLGICLGMQLLLEESYEHGHHRGLGILPGSVLPLKDIAEERRVPNIGWAKMEVRRASPLLKGLAPPDCTFYFVHSFYCNVTQPAAVVGHLSFGKMIDVMVELENISGCQFHPEKSQKAGLTLLRNFASS